MPDLVDFADFYATFMEAANIDAHWTDPIDGQSFFGRLSHNVPSSRSWLFTHYQPYWGQVPGQFARTADYKLYDDGRFYHVPNDLDEQQDLSSSVSQDARLAKSILEQTMKKAPPASREKGSRSTQIRPTYPSWSFGE